MSGGPAPAADRAALVALVRARVRLRFALDAEAFADRLQAMAADRSPGVAVTAYAERLSLDDLYLASACAGGEAQAWEEVGSRHFAFLRSFVRRIVGDRSTDVADQVIADLWQRDKIARFDGRSTLRTWLGVVVTRAALNALRAERPALSLESAAEDGHVPPQLRTAPRPHDEESARLLGGLLPRALAGLGAEDKLLLQLHYEQGLTLEQIGRIHGGSKAALSRRLSRIRQDLHGALDELARRELGTSAKELWSGVDPRRIELDLATAIAAAASSEPPGGCAVQEV